ARATPGDVRHTNRHEAPWQHRDDGHLAFKLGARKERLMLLAWILIVLGVVIAIVSALANPLGLGRYPGFGWKKTLGAVVGVLLAAAGVCFLFGLGIWWGDWYLFRCLSSQSFGGGFSSFDVLPSSLSYL